ncbi:DUF3209 family protein [Sorangium sp. So ce1097]|uniref:DUF3209 family protein n=1 Tax=Sorangium sp. So ce1097 TaxID=3133330 RepID=UPI003F5FB7C7
MACHEIAALRLGLMNILGIDDPGERAHELAELGPAAAEPGPVSAMLRAGDLRNLSRLFEGSLAELQEKVAKTPPGDAKLPYLRSLLILTKQVELDLRAQVDGLARLYRELEEMHDFVHEIYPAEQSEEAEKAE